MSCTITVPVEGGVRQYIVEHFSPARANRPFSASILPRRLRCYLSVTNAYRANPPDEAAPGYIVHDRDRASAVEFAVNPSHITRRRRCRRTTRPYSSRKESVGTTAGLSKRCSQCDCKESFSSSVTVQAMYFATLVWPTSMSSLSSLPRRRGCGPERVGQANVPDQPADLQWHPRSPAAPPRSPRVDNTSGEGPTIGFCDERVASMWWPALPGLRVLDSILGTRR